MSDITKVAFLVAAEGIEKVELTEPWTALEDAGFQPVLLSPDSGTVQLFEHLDKADTRPVDLQVAAAEVDDYLALVLPGGVANPDALRTDGDAVAFIRDFFNSGRPVAAICHAPWTLIEAGVVHGLELTSYPSLKTDLVNAGATWLDERVVTSRNPDDLPVFISALLDSLHHGAAGTSS